MAASKKNTYPWQTARVQWFSRTVSEPAPWIAPIFSRFSVWECDETITFAPHRHANDFEIIVIDRGSCHCRVNDDPLTLKPGEILVIKPGDLHADTYPAGTRFFGIYFYFDPAFLSHAAALLFRSSVSAQQQRVRGERRIFWPIFRRLQEEAGARDHFAAHVQDALMEEFFWRLVRVLPADAVCPEFVGLSEDHRFQTELQRLFQEHIHEPLAVAEMAKQLRMSESLLSHKCKELLGQSPAHVFIRSKIERAQFLLQNTDLRVKDISARLGFTDPYHFSKIFKRHTGRAPSTYRQPA